jgi:hypothetical protein
MMLVARDGVVGLLSGLAGALCARLAWHRKVSATEPRTEKANDRPHGRQFQTRWEERA